jgi:hypothetical protein
MVEEKKTMKKISKTSEKKPEVKKSKKEVKVGSKNTEGKIKDLKIELLKNPTKRKSIKREIARLLTLETKPIKGGK